MNLSVSYFFLTRFIPTTGPIFFPTCLTLTASRLTVSRAAIYYAYLLLFPLLLYCLFYIYFFLLLLSYFIKPYYFVSWRYDIIKNIRIWYKARIWILKEFIIRCNGKFCTMKLWSELQKKILMHLDLVFLSVCDNNHYLIVYMCAASLAHTKFNEVLKTNKIWK